MTRAGGADDRERVVMLRALGLGDFLVAVPALRAIARAYPGHRRVLVAPAWLAPLIGMLRGAVTDVSHADFRDSVGSLPARASGAAVAINLHGSGPESHRALLESAPGSLVSYGHREVPESGPGQWREDDHEMRRWCRLLDAHGIPADPGDWRLDCGDVPRMPAWKDAVVVHPGAASPARRWPPERWAEVVASLAGSGRRVLLTGTASERAMASQVAAAAGLDPRCVTAGRTRLGELAHGLCQARLLISGDTGVAHLATAVGLPSVALFGPTPPQRWGPPPDQDGRHIVLWAGRAGDPRAAEPDPGLLEIAPQTVIDAISELSGDPRHPRPAAV